MKLLLRILKRIWFFNFLRRIYQASKVYNYRYFEILKWAIKSKEDTNYTYDLTESNILYLSHIISVVTGVDSLVAKKYIDELTFDIELKQTIIKTISKSKYKKFADNEVRYGRRLGWYAFVRILKPKVVIETGVDKGLGSILICSALLKNKEEGFEGKYYGTDINPEAGYLLTGKYAKVGEILYGDSIESLSKFNDTIDLFINDSDHSAEYEYKEYLTIKNNIGANTIILGDNSHISEKLALFSNETGRSFLFFKEEPKDHWYPGAGIGISFNKIK